MEPERWERVKDLFQEALERAPEERAPLLREVCREDLGLQIEVERLLSAHGSADGFLSDPVCHLGPSDPLESPAAPAPARIGGYRIVRALGEGGMGTVYLAEREEAGFHKTVAIKVVRQGMEADFVLRRFQTERQILASLEHPGIARLYDGGTTEEGFPYFVMEYVEGNDLLTWCDGRKLPIAERLRLFRGVCEAVQFAHQNLVVHRDLKPDNILVKPEGHPKLLDFGIAKLLSPLETGGEKTGTLVRLMTPDFASPEQVLGERVTTASDVYALGVVLYELLSGHRPYRIRGRNASEIERAVCEETPERPSTAAARRETIPAKGDGPAVTITPAEVSASRATTQPRLRRTLRGDLDNIVLKALEKDPARRYATAAELSEDLRRHLDGFPVRALPDRGAYRAAKFLRRHRVGALVALAASLFLVAGLAVAVWQARIARGEREVAQAHFNDLRRLLNTFLFEFHDSVRDLPGATPTRQLVVSRALEYLERISLVGSPNPDVQRELAEAYQRISRVQGGVFASHLGDTAGAMKSVTKALAIRRELARSFPTNKADQIGLAHAELDAAQVLLPAGETQKAVEATRRAVALLQSLARSSPGDLEIAAELARSTRYLGTALSWRGQREEAVRALRSAVAGFSRIAEADPGNVASLRELASTQQILIHNLPESEVPIASQSYEAAVAIQNQLVLRQPANAGIRRELAYTHFSMGYFRERQGDTAGAIEAYSEALRIRELLTAEDPRNADAQLRLADAYHGLGFVKARAGIPGALEHLHKALELMESIAKLDPADTRTTRTLAYLYGSLGMAAETDAPNDGLEAGLRTSRDWYAKSRQAFVDLKKQGRLTGAELSEIATADGKLASIDRKLSDLVRKSR